MFNAKVKMAIFEHAKSVYPNECCGVVTQKSRVQRFHPIDNVYDKPEEGFELDATQYAEACERGEVIAIVHSHTGDGATTIPSAHDTCMCDEFQIPYIIVSLPEGDMRVVEPEVRPLTGRPWALGAYDCWGLVMAWHRENGVELTDHRTSYPWWKKEYGGNLYEELYLGEGFVPTGKPPEPGDMIIMKLQCENWNHAGIYLGNNQILHHLEGRLSSQDLYSGWYRDHTVMVCRHKDLK